MAGLIRGQQLEDAPLGVTTTKINDDAVTSAKVDGSVLSTDAANTPPANDYSALNKKIIDVAPGTAGTDAVNYSQLTGIAQGMTWKASCFTGTIQADGSPEPLQDNPIFAGAPGGPGGTLTANVNNTGLTVGGLLVKNLGQRVLVTSYVGPGDSQKNGIYELTQKATVALPWVLTRVADMDINTEVPTAATAISESTSFAFGYVFVVQNPKGPAVGTPFVINTDEIEWVKFPLPLSLTPGNGITIAGPVVSVDITPTNSPSARGLTFSLNKLEISLTPLSGLKFNDTNGTLETLLAGQPNVDGGLTYTGVGAISAKFEPNSGLKIGPTAGLVINPKTNAVPSAATGGLALNGSNELVAQVNLNAALSVNNVNEIELNVEPSTPTTGGLEVGPTLGIQAKWDPAGGITYSAVGGKLLLGNPLNLPVGLLLSATGVYNNVVNVEEFGNATATAVTTGLQIFSALTETPFKANGKNAVIMFFINGVKYRVGATVNDPIYYSNDGGVTPRPLNAISAGDTPHRGGALQFPTFVTDEVNVDYLSAVP